jgi:hypothetical protein
MQRRSWSSLALNFESREYTHAEAVGRFVEQTVRCLNPLALMLFGSLARGDYHRQSDADFCVVLATNPPTPFAGYDRVAALDPSGAVQPLVYGAEQFRRMIRSANGLALEVLADDTFRQEIEGLSARTARELGIERTDRGWRLTRASPA